MLCLIASCGAVSSGANTIDVIGQVRAEARATPVTEGGVQIDAELVARQRRECLNKPLKRGYRFLRRGAYPSPL